MAAGSAGFPMTARTRPVEPPPGLNSSALVSAAVGAAKYAFKFARASRQVRKEEINAAVAEKGAVSAPIIGSAGPRISLNDWIRTVYGRQLISALFHQRGAAKVSSREFDKILHQYAARAGLLDVESLQQVAMRAQPWRGGDFRLYHRDILRRLTTANLHAVLNAVRDNHWHGDLRFVFEDDRDRPAEIQDHLVSLGDATGVHGHITLGRKEVAGFVLFAPPFCPSVKQPILFLEIQGGMVYFLPADLHLSNANQAALSQAMRQFIEQKSETIRQSAALSDSRRWAMFRWILPGSPLRAFATHPIFTRDKTEMSFRDGVIVNRRVLNIKDLGLRDADELNSAETAASMRPPRAKKLDVLSERTRLFRHQLSVELTAASAELKARVLVPGIIRTIPSPTDHRIVTIGDVHGEWRALLAILLANRLIHPITGNWIGGASELILIGDVINRGFRQPLGEHPLETNRYVHRLAHQAAAAGGKVVITAGNAEIRILERFRIGLEPYLNPAAVFETLRRSLVLQGREKHLRVAHEAAGLLFTHAFVPAAGRLAGESLPEFVRRINAIFDRALGTNDFSDPIFRKDHGIMFRNLNAARPVEPAFDGVHGHNQTLSGKVEFSFEHRTMNIDVGFTQGDRPYAARGYGVIQGSQFTAWSLEPRTRPERPLQRAA